MFDYKTGEQRSCEFTDEKDKLDYYDFLCNITLMNIFTRTKEYKDIRVKPNSSKNFLFFLNACMATGGIAHKKVKLVGNPLYYIFYVIRHFGFKGFKNLYWSWRDSNIDAFEILQYEIESLDIPPIIFEDIYNEYYDI